MRISTEPFAEYRETSSVGRVLPWFADGPLLASSPRRKSSGVSKAIAIWALSFTRLQANRNLLTAMSLLPKSIHRCRRYPTKFNSGLPWCTTPIEAESSLGPDSHHPIISLSGIPSAVIVLRILHPILASTLCAANPLARIAEPMIAL